jgi:hypothetical protein
MGGNIGVAVGPGTTVCEGVAEAVGVSVFVGNGYVGRGRGVFVGTGLCVSARDVLTVALAVSMISASLSVGVDSPLPQDTSITAARNEGINNVLPKMFILPLLLISYKETLNGSRLFQGGSIRVEQHLLMTLLYSPFPNPSRAGAI